MLAVILALLMTGAVSRQDLPAVTERHGAFAFPNVRGTELIVAHEVPDPAALHRAICGGRTVSVRFVRRQTVADPHPGRESPRTFGRLAGTVFQVLGRAVDSDSTCFVAADSLLEGAELLPVRAFSRPAACTPTERRRFAAARDRLMKSCWTVAAVRRRDPVGVVEYVRAGRDALGSLIVVMSERAIVIDFAAEYRSEGEELWRAGDGGEFSPFGFNVPFIIRRGGSYFVAVDWAGEEGNSVSLYASEPGIPARGVISDHWYRAPR